MVCQVSRKGKRVISPTPTLSSPPTFSFSPHHLSLGLLPPLPDTLPRLQSIYGSKSSSFVWHEGSAMMVAGRGRICHSLALTISTLLSILHSLMPKEARLFHTLPLLMLDLSVWNATLSPPQPAPPKTSYQALASLSGAFFPQSWSIFRRGSGVCPYLSTPPWISRLRRGPGEGTTFPEWDGYPPGFFSCGGM